jgi:NCS1 family nucleobase:cation symporter-1
VPAMYDPHGRYRYCYGIVCELAQNVIGDSTADSNQNWRAVLALVVSVPPNLPGLVASIAPLVDVGRIKHVYDFAWLFGVRLHVITPWLQCTDII